MLNDLLGLNGSRRRKRMPTLEDIAQDAARGLVSGIFNLAGGVIMLGLMAAVVVFVGHYMADERIEARAEEQKSEKQESDQADRFSYPPSSYDGWGDESVESNP